MIKNIRHLAIVVNDLKKSQDFYESFFGFKKVSEEIESGPFIEKVVGLPNAKIHWVKLATPNGVLIELLKYLNPTNEAKKPTQIANQLGHSHLAFTVHSMDGFLKAFQSRQGHLVNPPELNPAGTVRVCYAYDPEGNLLEIVEEL